MYPTNPVKNLLALAGRMTDHNVRESAMLTLGIRLGIAIALWRPQAASALLEATKIHTIRQAHASLEEMSNFEIQCMESIFQTQVNNIPSPLERN